MWYSGFCGFDVFTWMCPVVSTTSPCCSMWTESDTLPLHRRGMPWKECHVMDERLRFVARLLEGEKMAPLCADFGISRKTGYKIFERYKDCGVVAFSDRTRRPHRQANRLAPHLEAVIVRLKLEYPGSRAPKIRK